MMTSAGCLDEEEPQDASSRFPDQVQDEIAHPILLLVDDGFDGAEVACARVEQVEEFEFLAIDPSPSALVRTGWRGAMVGHDVLLGPGQDVEATVAGSGGAEDWTYGEEGVKHQEDIRPQTQTDAGGDMNETRGA